MLGEMTFDGRARGAARINNPTAARARIDERSSLGGKEDKDAANRGKKFKEEGSGERRILQSETEVPFEQYYKMTVTARYRQTLSIKRLRA